LFFSFDKEEGLNCAEPFDLSPTNTLASPASSRYSERGHGDRWMRRQTDHDVTVISA
jgi:hypothetical protein